MKDDFAYLVALSYYRQLKKDKKKLDDLLPELKNIADIIADDKKIFYFLNHLSIPPSEKIALINKITDNNKIIKLLAFLTKTKRINELNEIIRQLVLFKDINDDYIDMMLRTPLDINENVLKKLQEEIEKFINKKVKIKIEMDTGLIGGILIKIGDRIIDYSVKNQLNSLKESLLQK